MGTSNTKIDWRIFETNFSADIRGAFQQLTEQLFCYEYKQPYGIFRFYNQPYIETMPIIVDTRTIGFQAKYFDASTKLSDKVEELCSAITGAHAKYPTLTHIVLYMHSYQNLNKTRELSFPQIRNYVNCSALYSI